MDQAAKAPWAEGTGLGLLSDSLLTRCLSHLDPQRL